MVLIIIPVSKVRWWRLLGVAAGLFLFCVIFLRGPEAVAAAIGKPAVWVHAVQEWLIWLLVGAIVVFQLVDLRQRRAQGPGG